MKVVAILASKGGSGKTTTTVTIATAAAELGIKVRILDMDPQVSSTRWGDRRGDTLPDVHSLHALRLERALDAAERDGIQLVVIDTPPRSDADALAAVRLSDLVIMPCLPKVLDVEAMLKTLDLVVAAHKEDAAYVMLNAVPARGSEVADTEQVLSGLRDFIKFVPTKLGDRKSFWRCMITGEGVVESEPEGKAASEARELASWLVKTLGMSVRRKRKKAA